MKFIDELKEKARTNRKTIVLPEGMDKRTYEAAEQILKEDFADIVVLATKEEFSKYSQGYDLEGLQVINPRDSEKLKEYAEQFYQLRKAKGMTEKQAYAMLISDHMYFACMMVKNGDADTTPSASPFFTIIQAKYI